MSFCRFCALEFSKRNLPGHVPWCHSNPRRAENSESIRKSKLGKKHTEEYKKKLSDTVNAKIIQGTWHNSFSRARTHLYSGVKLYGLWEVAYAKHLDSVGIRWRRPDETFDYEFEGRARKYTPNFYLIDENVFVEIKGYPTPKDFAKWKHFPQTLRILFGRDLFRMGLITNFKDFGPIMLEN